MRRAMSTPPNLARRGPARQGNAFVRVPLSATRFIPPIGGGAVLQAVTGSLYISCIVYLPLMAATWLLMRHLSAGKGICGERDSLFPSLP